MTTIDLVYFNAGGGHRAAALALQALCVQQRRPWAVRLVNLVDVLDPQSLFQRCTGMAPEDLYNKRLARGWTLGLAQELKLLQGLVRMAHGTLVQRLATHWQRSAPDLVVSLIPNFNRALGEGLAQARPGVPFMTVMTDMADHPPHFWREGGVAQHLVCGTAQALRQARAAGHDPGLLHAVSGMLIHPDFYAPLALDRAAERRALGLPVDRPVGVVMFGGAGSMAMDAIARALPDQPLVLLCGHHAKLAARLRSRPGAAPHAVVGFTREVRRYLALGDFFIGKPGPGSLSEAVHMGLPVITVRNAFTMPQERYNTEWLHTQGLGLVLGGFGDVAAGVRSLCAALPAYRARVAQVRNRAVFEVVETMAQVLAPCSRRPSLALVA
ncbi:galactosyldiacylglycerol synthase [Pseudorhodoferax sp. Leaf267]|uniref:galactosyldiacylglycerol synthase n=1 Tax=Pseudorhodoferax sp. Leaf267 TaxID=1736316 RepID=UPI0006FE9CB2|nr:galactosyldiacylglycerol synthase [Pseudorhodoferax sp. Leaf267]KQP17761.1 galactosyldiacylglycerol synthase [Pseudorhodoferax sp. Leaf267]